MNHETNFTPNSNSWNFPAKNWKSDSQRKRIHNYITLGYYAILTEFMSYKLLASKILPFFRGQKGSLEPVVPSLLIVRSLNRCESERVFVPAGFWKKMSQTDGCPCAFRLTDPDEKRGLLFHEFWQQSLTTKDVTHISQPSNLCMNECFVRILGEESLQVQKLIGILFSFF